MGGSGAGGDGEADELGAEILLPLQREHGFGRLHRMGLGGAGWAYRAVQSAGSDIPHPAAAAQRAGGPQPTTAANIHLFVYLQIYTSIYFGKLSAPLSPDSSKIGRAHV